MKLKLENHFADPIGTLIGGNPATGGVIPEDSSYLGEMLYSLSGKNTVHNCYGGSQDKDCTKLWDRS